jgi:hypothetical protein
LRQLAFKCGYFGGLGGYSSGRLLLTNFDTFLLTIT